MKLSWPTDVLSISRKLWLMALLIGLTFALIVIIAGVTFHYVGGLATKETDSAMGRMTKSSQTARTINSVTQDIQLLSRTFLINNQQLAEKQSAIRIELQQLKHNAQDPGVTYSISQLSQSYSTFVETSETVKSVLTEIRLTSKDIHAEITDLEQLTSKWMIEYTLQGRDTFYIDQLLTLVTSFRENLLIIDKLLAEDIAALLNNPGAQQNDQLQLAIDDFLLRLQTLTASPPEIKKHVIAAIEMTSRFRTLAAEFHNSLIVMDKNLMEIKRSQRQALGIIKALEHDIASQNAKVNRTIGELTNKSIYYVTGFSIIVVTLMGLGVFRIIQHSIENPLTETLTTIKQIREGQFHSNFQSRHDEWGLISTALTEMAQELSGSYEALQNSEEKYRLLVENQTDLVVKIDTNGMFEFVSPSYCRLFGKSEAELLGRAFMPMVHEDDRENTARRMENLYHAPYKAYVEQRALTKDGWKWLGWMDTAIVDDSGRVVSIIGVGRDISERKQFEAELEHLANHDSLTGLYNRKVLQQRLEDEIQRANRYKHPLSIFMMDIDHFKQVNDTFGHNAGDEVLIEFARLLQSSIRQTDYAARYGGEEFIVILPETELTKAVDLAERLREKIAENIAVINNERLNITVSMGVATFPVHALSWQELLEKADMAMYAAKKSGRNCVQTFSAIDDRTFAEL